MGQQSIHASAVSLGNEGVLILGKSGSGKSSLALELIARGATLVADDQVSLQKSVENGVILSAPEPLKGLIEARGVGIVSLPHEVARLKFVVDMDRTETERLPQPHTELILGVEFPCLRKVESAAFPAMVLACLAGERKPL